MTIHFFSTPLEWEIEIWLMSVTQLFQMQISDHLMQLRSETELAIYFPLIFHCELYLTRIKGYYSAGYIFFHKINLNVVMFH